tara:strand:+ start:159 stop:719 length:561 start_codon:yes stop_codon:yes gene_type:complete
MKLTEANLKEMIKEQLEESSGSDRYSNFKPWGPEAAGLVYYDRSDSTPPIPPGFVRTAAVIDAYAQPDPARLKRHQKNHIVIYLKQPGYKVYDRDARDPTATVLPYGEGEQTFIEHEIQLDGRYIEPADDGRYIDVANFILKRKKITDQYGNLLDFNGRIIAGKKLQKRFSGASDMSWNDYLETLK